MRSSFRGVVLLLPVLAAVACGGGGGGSGDGGVVNPSPNPVIASFRSDDNTPTVNTVALIQGSRNADLVTVRVTVTDATAVFATAFEIVYDTTKAGYVNWSPGSLLEQGGHVPTYTISDSGTGRVVVAASRTGAAGTVNAAGTVTVVNLTFRMKVVGESRADFATSPVLYDGQNPPVAKSDITWTAGSLVGTE